MTTYFCRKCGQRCAVIYQESTHPTQPASVQVTCWTRMCGNYGLTKDTRDTADIDALFIVEDTDQDNPKLEQLFRNAAALQRLAAAPIPQEAD